MSKEGATKTALREKISSLEAEICELKEKLANEIYRCTLAEIKIDVSRHEVEIVMRRLKDLLRKED